MLVRPPKWELGQASRGRLKVDQLKKLQNEYLEKFRKFAAKQNWTSIQRDHFDWWMFPIEDGSQMDFHLRSEEDIRALKNDALWRSQYLESIRIVSRGWGWDVEKSELITDGRGGSWDNWDIRLAKMIRSLWLFEEEQYFLSLQSFARHIQENVYHGRGFHYGSICLDEMLHMVLPRKNF